MRNPTANDLSWVIRFLRARVTNTFYQEVGDVFAMTNFSGQTELFNVFDEKFAGTIHLLVQPKSILVVLLMKVGFMAMHQHHTYLLTFTESDGDEVYSLGS